jgi:hypothetical protein
MSGEIEYCLVVIATVVADSGSFADIQERLLCGAAVIDHEAGEVVSIAGDDAGHVIGIITATESAQVELPCDRVEEEPEEEIEAQTRGGVDAALGVISSDLVSITAVMENATARDEQWSKRSRRYLSQIVQNREYVRTLARER